MTFKSWLQNEVCRLFRNWAAINNRETRCYLNELLFFIGSSRPRRRCKKYLCAICSYGCCSNFICLNKRIPPPISLSEPSKRIDMRSVEDMCAILSWKSRWCLPFHQSITPLRSSLPRDACFHNQGCCGASNASGKRSLLDASRRRHLKFHGVFFLHNKHEARF